MDLFSFGLACYAGGVATAVVAMWLVGKRKQPWTADDFETGPQCYTVDIQTCYPNCERVDSPTVEPEKLIAAHSIHEVFDGTASTILLTVPTLDPDVVSPLLKSLHAEYPGKTFYLTDDPGIRVSDDGKFFEYVDSPTVEKDQTFHVSEADSQPLPVDTTVEEKQNARTVEPWYTPSEKKPHADDPEKQKLADIMSAEMLRLSEQPRNFYAKPSDLTCTCGHSYAWHYYSEGRSCEHPECRCEHYKSQEQK